MPKSLEIGSRDRIFRVGGARSALRRHVMDEHVKDAAQDMEQEGSVKVLILSIVRAAETSPSSSGTLAQHPRAAHPPRLHLGERPNHFSTALTTLASPPLLFNTTYLCIGATVPVLRPTPP